MVKELRMPFGSTSVKRCCGPIRTCSLDEQPREQKGHSASWLTLRRAEMRGLLGRQLEGDSISKVSAESASRNTSSSHWGASVCIHDPNHLNPGKRRIRGGWLKTVCSLKPMKKCLQLTAFFFLATLFFRAVQYECHTSSWIFYGGTDQAIKIMAATVHQWLGCWYWKQYLFHAFRSSHTWTLFGQHWIWNRDQTENTQKSNHCNIVSVLHASFLNYSMFPGTFVTLNIPEKKKKEKKDRKAKSPAGNKKGVNHRFFQVDLPD